MSENDDVVFEPEEDGAEEKAEGKLKKLRDELKKTREEKDEYLAGWQRSKADYVNLSRRMREEGDVIKKQAASNLAREVVAVFDSLEAAYSVAKGTGAVEAGIGQVITQLEGVLKDQGITRFTPKAGEVFDPFQHEVVGTVATEAEEEDNTILETLQSGYAMDGAILRPARVSVRHYQPS